MSIALYEQARQSFASGEINWGSDTIKMLLVDLELYTPNLVTHRYFTSIPTEAIVATATLTGKTATNGECKASDVVFQNVSGETVESFLIYKDTGTGATSPLILVNDGVIPVNCAAVASVGATTLTIDPLFLPAKTGNQVVFSGGVTVTVTADAAQGARSLAITALTSGQSIAAGEAGTAYVGGKLRFTPNSGNAEMVWGGTWIFKL